MPRSLRCLLRLVVVAALLAVAIGILRRRQRGDGDSAAPAEWPPLDLEGSISGGPGAQVERAASRALEVAPSVEVAHAPSVEIEPASAARAAVVTPWVEPTGGACPDSHPVKAKLSSKIFHVPGGANYQRTKADRCYLDPAGAEADGFRRSRA